MYFSKNIIDPEKEEWEERKTLNKEIGKHISKLK